MDLAAYWKFWDGLCVWRRLLFRHAEKTIPTSGGSILAGFMLREISPAVQRHYSVVKDDGVASVMVDNIVMRFSIWILTWKPLFHTIIVGIEVAILLAWVCITQDDLPVSSTIVCPAQRLLGRIIQ